MILAAHSFERDAGFLEDRAEFGVDAGIFAVPERAEGIFIGPVVVRRTVFRDGERRRIAGSSTPRRRSKLPNEWNLAVRADVEAVAVFGLAFGANHSSNTVYYRMTRQEVDAF
jgi:hypothetical protein